MSDLTEMIFDIVIDALIDTVKLLPFMFAAFFFMEYFEHKAGDKLSGFLKKAGRSSVGGTLVGAAVGCIPQCGFSAAASNLYAGELISTGTLIAVFVSTSDEALPILISNPESSGLIWKLIVAKLIIAVAAGLVTDALCKLFKNHRRDEPFGDICVDCGCGSHGIWYAALKHTLSIALFILIVNLVLGGLFAAAGEENVMEFLEGLGFVQPIIAAFVGMIPNCAASVIITQLYVKGAITFGSAVAGLATGAGVGLAVLYKVNKSVKENVVITVALYLIGAVSGIIINLFA